jgi:hypothetical protein
MGFEIIIFIGIIFFLFLILIIFTHKRISLEKKQGYPVKDEMTKRMVEKAGFFAYLISVPMWLIISFLTLILHSDFMNEFNVIIGIIGMALNYLIAAVIVIKRGVYEKSH